MTFEELVAEVVSNTNRPDLGFVANGGSGEIPLTVRKSTLLMHNKDFFYKDIQNADVKFDYTAYVQVLDTSALPRYRSMSYFRKWDPSYNNSQLNPTILPPLYDTATGNIARSTALGFLTPIDPSLTLDEYNRERLDVMYQLGDELYMKSSTSILYGKCGWYAYPQLGDSSGVGYLSWIARDYPYAITEHATSTIFARIGQQDQARKMDSPGGSVAEQIEVLIKNNVQMAGK